MSLSLPQESNNDADEQSDRVIIVVASQLEQLVCEIFDRYAETKKMFEILESLKLVETFAKTLREFLKQ